MRRRVWTALTAVVVLAAVGPAAAAPDGQSDDVPSYYDATAPTGWMTSAATDRVHDIAQIGDTVYVAGAFGGIRPTRTGTVVPQAWLAAFDAVSGAPRAGLRPGPERHGLQPRALARRHAALRGRGLHLGQRGQPQPDRRPRPCQRGHRPGLHAEHRRRIGPHHRPERRHPLRRGQLRLGERPDPQPPGGRVDGERPAPAMGAGGGRRDRQHARAFARRQPPVRRRDVQRGQRRPRHCLPRRPVGHHRPGRLGLHRPARAGGVRRAGRRQRPRLDRTRRSPRPRRHLPGVRRLAGHPPRDLG